MYKKEFDTLWQKGQSFGAYMFYGQCNYLVDKYTQMVAEKYCVDENASKMYFEEFDAKNAKNFLLQSSLFSSNNTLIIRLEKPLNKTDTTLLIEACNTNTNSTVIFACMGDGEFKTMENYFSVKNNSVSVRFFAPFPNEALFYIQEEAKKLKIDYDIAALQHLYTMHKEDLSLCINDLQKLAILKDKVTSGDVDAHCFGFTCISIEDFIYKLLSKQPIQNDLQQLFESGVNEIFLLTQITTFLQQLFMINAYARAIGTPSPKEILGFSPPKHIWEKKARLAISIKPQKFQQMLDFVLGLELELKTSKIDQPKTYVIAMLSKFSVHIR